MSSINSLMLAVEQAVRRRDEAVLQLMQARKNLDFGRHQLLQLQDYVGEKDARFLSPQKNGFSSEVVRHHYQFMGRLQHAIGLQCNMVVQLEERLSQAQDSLMNAEIRLQGLRKVVQLRQAEIQQRKDRFEQRQTDEFSNQQYARKRIRLRKGESS